MKPILVAPLIAVVLAGAGAGAYFAVAGAGSGDEAPATQPTSTPTEQPSATPTPAAEPTPTPAPTAVPATSPPVQSAYRNAKYGYEVTLPVDWRLASAYMQQFAELTSNPRVTAVPEDHVVLTTLSESEEQQFIERASQEIGIALSPWFKFALGHSIRISHSWQSQVAFLENTYQGGLTVENTDIREETLDSGKPAIRVTRREANDNGDYTYDAVYISFATCPLVGPDHLPCQGVVFKIVKTPDYARQRFEAIFRSFREGK